METQLATVQFSIISILIYIETTSTNQAGECRQLLFPSKFFFGNKILKNHDIATRKVSALDSCQLKCYHEPNCVSINFNVTPDSKGLYECELNNATHRIHKSELKKKHGYVYKGAESACDRASCENGGTCQSGFTDKGYRCVCPLGFTSAHCEKDDNKQDDGKEAKDYNDDNVNEDPTRENANMTMALKLTTTAPTTVEPGDDDDDDDDDDDEHSSDSEDSEDSESDDE